MELERIIKVLEIMKEYRDNKIYKSRQKNDVCEYIYNYSKNMKDWGNLNQVGPIDNPLGIKKYKEDGDGRNDRNRISFNDSKEIIEALDDFLL